MNNSLRQPGEIEIWNRKSNSWTPNSYPCYVSDEWLCNRPGCNRRLRNKRAQRAELRGSPRYCSTKCANTHKWVVKRNGKRQ